jgi:hypothetical protein
VLAAAASFDALFMCSSTVSIRPTAKITCMSFTLTQVIVIMMMAVAAVVLMW